LHFQLEGVIAGDWRKTGSPEGVGFEPTETCASSVFKTDALNRSATPPLRHNKIGPVAVRRKLRASRHGRRTIQSVPERLVENSMRSVATRSWETACSRSKVI